MEPIKRIKRNESTWRELFARQAASSLSVLEFCRAERLNPGVFRRWRSMLSGDGKVVKIKPGTQAKGASPFIDVGTVDAAHSRFEVRLELGSGMILSIARG